MRILAFDPGYGRLGWGAVCIEHSLHSLKLLDYGVIQTEASKNMSLRMQELYTGLRQLLPRLHPDRIAMERLYFSRNQKTAVGVYQAQGLILAAAGEWGLPIQELEPKRIKQILTASGRATKQQLMAVTCRLLNRKTPIYPDDAADAVAAAIAAYFHFYSAQKIADTGR